MIDKGEGKELLDSYLWFKDKNVTNSFLCSVDELINDLPDTLKILGIGSGVGELDLAVKRSLEEKQKAVSLVITNRITRDTIHQTDVSVLEVDNKNLPFNDGEFDLVIARSVTHYERNQDDEKRVLREVYRVLKGGGFFITQAPYLVNENEVNLLDNIHSVVGKHLNRKTQRELLEVHSSVFGNVVQSNSQCDIPVSITKESFLKRYGLTVEEGEQVREILERGISKETPNFWVRDQDFGWNINYLTLICKKF